MRYTPIVRGLLSGFYDDKKHKIKLPKGVSIKFVKKSNLEGHRFQICFRGTPVSPELFGDLVLENGILTCQTLKSSFIDFDLNKMEVYPEYFDRNGSVARGRDEKTYFIQKDGSFLELPYKYPYNYFNVKGAKKREYFEDLVVLQNSKGLDALYNSKTLKQIIPFEINGMIDIKSCLGSGADGEGEKVYLIMSNEQQEDKNESIHLLGKHYTFSFYNEKGKKLEEVSNASLIWQQNVTDANGKNVTHFAFRTGKETTLIVTFDNNKSKVSRKIEVPFVQKTAGEYAVGSYLKSDIVHMKDGSIVFVTQSQDSQDARYGLQKINPDGVVEKLLENCHEKVTIKHDKSGIYADFKSKAGEDTKVGRLSLEGSKHTFDTSVSSFAKLAKRYFPAKANASAEEAKGFGEQNKPDSGSVVESGKSESGENVSHKGN